jgi:hypothetical protein
VTDEVRGVIARMTVDILGLNGAVLIVGSSRWFVRLGISLENALRRRCGNPFRTFVHPPSEMIRMIEHAK